LHFVCLSPVIALAAITGGETAILKGVRQLGQLAKISVSNIVGALLTSVPLYYAFHDAAIVPSLIIIAAVQMVLTIQVSYKLYPLSISFRKDDIGKGMSMVKLGIAFVVAGILGSGADFAIRSYLNKVSSLDVVGLYNAAYMMTMVYAGMVFSAMETDYFPRLSAVNKERGKRNMTVNHQMEVSLLMVSPLLVALMVGLPIILPTLYSNKFLPAMGMMQIVIVAMYLRSMTLPMAYLTLATGDSRGYMMLESIYDIAIVVFTIIGFNCFGLIGAGAAILLANIIDFIVIHAYTHNKFQYSVGVAVMKYFAIQFSIGVATLTMAFTVSDPIAYWTIGIALVVLSGYISLRILQSKVSLWNKLTSKYKLFKRDE